MFSFLNNKKLKCALCSSKKVDSTSAKISYTTLDGDVLAPICKECEEIMEKLNDVYEKRQNIGEDESVRLREVDSNDED